MGTGVERVLVLCLLEIQLSEFRGTECWGGETTVLLSVSALAEWERDETCKEIKDEDPRSQKVEECEAQTHTAIEKRGRNGDESKKSKTNPVELQLEDEGQLLVRARCWYRGRACDRIQIGWPQQARPSTSIGAHRLRTALSQWHSCPASQALARGHDDALRPEANVRSSVV